MVKTKKIIQSYKVDLKICNLQQSTVITLSIVILHISRYDTISLLNFTVYSGNNKECQFTVGVLVNLILTSLSVTDSVKIFV